MNNVHFKSLDLNLLRVFEALFAERSATLAGARLGLSQSAISHALGRLRRSLDDELFVRGPDGLLPTTRGASLGPQIIDALKHLESALTAPAFDPSESDRQFIIGASTYFTSVLLPGVMRRFVELAPRARLRVRGENLLAEELDRGRLDMIAGAFDEVPPRFTFTPLFQETGVWVIRSDHPALDAQSTIEAPGNLPQVVIVPDDGSALGVRLRGNNGVLRRPVAWRTDARLSGIQSEAQSALTVPDTYSALSIVRQTEMIAFLPRRLAKQAAALGGLTLVEPSFVPAPLAMGAVTRAGEQGPIPWLLSLLRQAADEL
ncbi:MAG: LysR family transcriptional regulator [Alphaproteobacteria bacterium]|nr:LysR family transcriptional regulator [Alphaproteobacteria bacterium]